MPEFNAEPYWDDFEASNGAKEQDYMRILFKPGYAVQARELTQIQSIIQNQIKNFGDHIFKDGSPVFGGQITLDTAVSYIKLQTAYNGVDIDLADFTDRVVFNASGSAKIRARVTAIDESQTQPTLMVRYLRASQFGDGSIIKTSSDSYAQLVASNASGVGSVASIAAGVFYVDGYFVNVQPQTIVLDAYGNSPTYKVGLQIDDNIVDYSADANLLDPAQSSFNYQAPGADRYQFNLVLAKRALDSVDDSKFFELLRVENGLITKQVVYPIYSELAATMARRTYDESGDYTVSPFNVTLSSNSACNDVFVVNVGPGKAYVKGFEYETFGTQKIQVNKARSTNTSTDYDLSVEYGNYLIANNLVSSANGLFDISKLDQLELHCVPRVNVNTSGTIGYNSTYIGTARVRDFYRYSSTEYITYLTDIQLASNTVTAAATASNSNTIVFPATYSNQNDAYANISVRVSSGASSGDVRNIVRYDGATKTAFCDLNFTSPIGSGQTAVLLYSTKDIDCLVEAVSNKLALNVAMDVSNTSKDTRNGTVISDTNKDSLLFMLPESYIANNTITNADFVAQKFFESRTFTSNGQFALTLSGNETYDYGADGTFLSSTTANTNLIVVVKSLGTATNFTVGQVVNLTGAGAAIRRDSSTQLTIFTGGNGTFTADIYARVKINNSESASNNRRTKTVRGNTQITALRSTDSPNYGVAVVGASDVKIDSSNGMIWFTNASDVNKTPGGNNSLCVADVYKIIKIFDSGATGYAPNTANAIDVTSRYFLDSGQNLNYYDHSKLVLRPGVSAPKGQLVAVVQYYEHSSAINGYFDVDSYPADQYASGSIPIFIDANGKKYNLRDAIDFRPTRDIGTSSSVASYTFIGMKNPRASESMELTYSYYVPRIDKLVLTKDLELKTLTGVASKYPLEPKDSENAMTLYKMSIPAYTANPSDVTLTKIDNKRYTMRDIGNLETRIKNVEYYTSLTMAEKKATDTTILYADNATAKEKYGIIADNFTGFEIAESSSPDFSCSIEKHVLGPYNNMVQIPLTVKTIGTYTQRNSKTLSLAYTEETCISQTAATANVSVQPYLYGVFDGYMTLSPQEDSWYSTTLNPEVISPAQVLPPPVSTQPVVSSGGGIGTVTGSFGSAPMLSALQTWFFSNSGNVDLTSLGMNGEDFQNIFLASQLRQFN